jgi:membrane glycosyltransferase
MKHCALAPIRGEGGLSGDILSHDFVEAALMRRAGYHVWLVSDLEGSYEQQPPNLLEELQRDRRWCQGNLQNARLIAEPGLHRVHRAMLATGAMAYLSAPLWLGFVLLGTGLWLFGGYGMFGWERVVVPELALLWCGTLVMLVLPRLLGIATVVLRREQQQFGGLPALLRGALFEGFLSALQAPVRMVGHTLFVIVALTGLKLEWKSPPREANAIAWGDAARRYAPLAVVVALLLGAALAIDPAAALWLSTIAVPLLLAVPTAVLTSDAQLGERVRELNLLTIPEETAAPLVLRRAWGYAQATPPSPAWSPWAPDRGVTAAALAAVGRRNTVHGSRGRVRREFLRRVMSERGTPGLSTDERMRLLSEPHTIMRMRGHRTDAMRAAA